MVFRYLPTLLVFALALGSTPLAWSAKISDDALFEIGAGTNSGPREDDIAILLRVGVGFVQDKGRRGVEPIFGTDEQVLILRVHADLGVTQSELGRTEFPVVRVSKATA